MRPDFHNAVNRIADVIMFENWLRFYFIREEKDDKLFIDIPEKAFGKMKKAYPHLFGLAEKLDKCEIDHDSSVREVCLFVASEIDGVALSDEMIQNVFSSNEFQLLVQLFGMWVQTHEKQLDEGFMDFGTWQKLFNEWKQSEKIQEMINAAEDRANRTTEASDKVQ